jgi:hypothetical protein
VKEIAFNFSLSLSPRIVRVLKRSFESNIAEFEGLMLATFSFFTFYEIFANTHTDNKIYIFFVLK